MERFIELTGDSIDRLRGRFSRTTASVASETKEMVRIVIHGTRRSSFHVIEKWAAFWLAFLGLLLFVSGPALGLLELAQASSRHGYYWLSEFSFIGSMLLILFWSVAFIALLGVEGMRLIFGTKNQLARLWKSNTPPFRRVEPPSNHMNEDEIAGKAKQKFWTYFLWGGSLIFLLFAVVMTVAIHYGERLEQGIDGLGFSVMDWLSMSVWVVSLDPIFEVFGVAFSPAEAVIWAIVFGPSLVLCALAASNFLYLAELSIRRDLLRIFRGRTVRRTITGFLKVGVYVMIGVMYSVIFLYEFVV